MGRRSGPTGLWELVRPGTSSESLSPAQAGPYNNIDRRWSGDVPVPNLERAGLPAPSVVRTAKIATLEANAASRIGYLEEADRQKSAKESADFCIPQESVFPIARDGAILFPTPQAKCLRRLALCCPGPEVLWKTGCSTRDISIMALSRDQVTSPPRRMSCMTPPSGMGNGYFAKTGAVLSTVGHHWSLQTFPSFILPSYGRFSGF